MNWLAFHLTSHGAAVRESDWVRLGVLISSDILIAFSVAGFAVIIERLLHLRRARALEMGEFDALRNAWHRDSPSQMRARLEKSAAPSALAVRAGWELQHDLGSRVASAQTARSAGAAPVRELVREAVNQGLENESHKLNRNVAILATVASTAPYVGLFGTVLGILAAFAKIAQTGQTGASTVAAPIAEALTATGLGLGVAIPAVIAYNFLNTRINDLMLNIETHALDLAARVLGQDEIHIGENSLPVVTANVAEANHAH